MYKQPNDLSELERYLYIDCRPLILNIIGNNDKETCKRYGLNMQATFNYRKFTYHDYITSDKAGQSRYLSILNIIRILETSGYKLTIRVELL